MVAYSIRTSRKLALGRRPSMLQPQRMAVNAITTPVHPAKPVICFRRCPPFRNGAARPSVVARSAETSQRSSSEQQQQKQQHQAEAQPPEQFRYARLQKCSRHVSMPCPQRPCSAAALVRDSSAPPFPLVQRGATHRRCAALGAADGRAAGAGRRHRRIWRRARQRGRCGGPALRAAAAGSVRPREAHRDVGAQPTGVV